MKKIVTVIGARPQIIKAAALSRAIRKQFAGQLQEIIIHTGQHYDENMSQIFFQELNIPRPDYNLQVGSGLHGQQTARMIEGIETILLNEKPAALVLYGDTNSTLAGAIAAAKLHIPIVHIEAGLRSFNKAMPEEINRIMCDHASTLLFAPTQTGYKNLLAEGFQADHQAPYSPDRPGIFHCGDVMYDNSLYFAELAEKNHQLLNQIAPKGEAFVLATIHRNNNTDIPERLNAIFQALLHIANQAHRLVLPLHPRTAKQMQNHLDQELLSEIQQHPHIHILPPVSFLEMIMLEKNARLILTDSGGVQKEAYFFNKPCIITRSETEWIEIVENGCGRIVNADKHLIIEAFNHFTQQPTMEFPALFGDGHAAEFICTEIIKTT